MAAELSGSIPLSQAGLTQLSMQTVVQKVEPLLCRASHGKKTAAVWGSSLPLL